MGNLIQNEKYPRWDEYLDDYISIHAHSHHFRDGCTSLEEFIDFGKKENKKSLALSDHGGLSGLLDFYYKCKEANIKGLLGVEIYYVLDCADKFRMITDPKTGKEKKKPITPFHLVLIAKNFKGYQSLIKINNEAQRNFYGKARVDSKILKKIIEEDGNNIICSTACMGSPLYKHPDHIFELANIFKDDLYLELQYHNFDRDKELAYVKQLVDYSTKYDIKLCITNDVHVANKEDLILHRLLVAIGRGLHIDDPAAGYLKGEGYWNITGQELWNICEGHIDKDVFYKAIGGVSEIIDKCNVELPYKKGQFVFPDFDTPIGYKDPYDYLQSLCFKSTRYNIETHKERLEYELKVFKDCGFVEYILPIQDIIFMCIEKGIEVGPGRGSAAGSLINYLLYITQLDPIEYGLSFERFITAKYNIETGLYENARQNAPDVDIDFEDPQRVFEYVRNKYGKDRVCGIGTQLLYGPKSAMKDVLRAFKVDAKMANYYTKFIPSDLNSLKDFMDDLPKELEPIREHLKLAIRLEGRVSTTSTHAAGVVFSNQLQSHIPLVIDKKNISKGSAAEFVSTKDNEQEAVDGSNEYIENEDSVKYVSQYDMESIKHTGFTKYDFLGLSTLKVLKMCQKLTGVKWLELNPRDVSHKVVYQKIFGQGNTTGIFQFSSHGMRGLLKSMEADQFEDIQACNALFRPQTLKQELDKDYVNNKFSGFEVAKDKDGLPHPIVYDILKETYGIPVYQEQVLSFLTKLGGLDSFEADTFRKILSDNKTNTDPKQLAKLMAYKDEFILGAVANNMSAEEALKIYEDLAKKSGYSFNKSHSACYAFLAFALAYFKYYYPFEFIVAVINDTPEELLDLLNDLKTTDIDSSKVRIEFPNINISSFHATVEEDEKGKFIQLGLMNIHGLGETVCQEIIDNRPYDLTTMVNLNDYFVNTDRLKQYQVDLDAYKLEVKEELDSRKAGRVFAQDNGKKPVVDREILGDFNECSGKRMSSKSLLMLKEAGAFSYIPVIDDLTIFQPSTESQIKHFGLVIQPELLSIPKLRKWNTIESVPENQKKGDYVSAVAGYILKLEEKLTSTQKPFYSIKIYNPIFKTTYSMNVWESSFKNKTNKFDGKIQYGFNDRGFKKGDAVVIKVKVQVSGYISYLSGHYLSQL